MKDVYLCLVLLSAIAGVAVLNLFRVDGDANHQLVKPMSEWEEWPEGFENPYFAHCATDTTTTFDACMNERKAEWIAVSAQRRPQ